MVLCVSLLIGKSLTSFVTLSCICASGLEAYLNTALILYKEVHRTVHRFSSNTSIVWLNELKFYHLGEVFYDDYSLYQT